MLANQVSHWIECEPQVCADGPTSQAAGRTLGSILSLVPRFKSVYRQGGYSSAKYPLNKLMLLNHSSSCVLLSVLQPNLHIYIYHTAPHAHIYIYIYICVWLYDLGASPDKSHRHTKQKDMYSKTSLSDHLHRSTPSLYRSLYLGSNPSPITIS